MKSITSAIPLEENTKVAINQVVAQIRPGVKDSAAVRSMLENINHVVSHFASASIFEAEEE